MQKIVKFVFDSFLTMAKSAQHHKKSEYYFHHKPVSAPALLFFSKTDLISPEAQGKLIAKDFAAKNIDVTLKLFDDSTHVNHYRMHKEEYLNHLMSHLETCELITRK
jgi:dienelactone hydrolase